MACNIAEGSSPVLPILWPSASSKSQTPATVKAISRALAQDEANGQNSAREQAHKVELAQVRQAAFQEGVGRGREEVAGQTKQANDRLARMAGDLAAYKARLRSEAEADVVKLSLAIARRILHRELQTDPESLQGIVHAALQQLENRQVSIVRTCAASVESVKLCLAQLGAARSIQVMPDLEMRTGDITFETSLGTLDVSVETQLKEIERGFADRLGLR